MERVRGVLAAIDRTPFELIVCNVADAAQRDEYLGRRAPLDRTDGLLIVSLSPDDDEAAALERAGVPVVLVDAHHPSLPRLVTDDVRGGTLATRHLLELGHERVGFVGDAASRASVSSPARGASPDTARRCAPPASPCAGSCGARAPTAGSWPTG